jgi:hypothetical protein
MKGKKCERKDGGKVMAYDAADSNVRKEADERKKGGRVKAEHKVEGERSKMHMGRPKRASGGRVGADKSPFTSARKVEQASAHKTES